jgi:hypothetical protein
MFSFEKDEDTNVSLLAPFLGTRGTKKRATQSHD